MILPTNVALFNFITNVKAPIIISQMPPPRDVREVAVREVAVREVAVREVAATEEFERWLDEHAGLQSGLTTSLSLTFVFVRS